MENKINIDVGPFFDGVIKILGQHSAQTKGAKDATLITEAKQAHKIPQAILTADGEKAGYSEIAIWVKSTTILKD